MSNVIKSIWSRIFPGASRGSFLTMNRRGEDFPGQWQRHIPRHGQEDILLSPYIFAAVSLISNDIAKMSLKLMERTAEGLWQQTENAAYSPVLRKPSKHENRQVFLQLWMLSVLIHGNAYILKLKDKRGVVQSLRVLDPNKVTILVSDQGEIFFELRPDNLAGTGSETVTVPASAIIHHKINPFFHSQVGVSPIRAAAMAAGLGLQIQENATDFFANASRPGSLLTTPGAVSDEAVHAIKEQWATRYSGRHGAGAVAVLADGLQYTPLAQIPATDAQTIETLGWTGHTVATVFHIPPFKLGLGDLPSYDSVQRLSMIYLSDCLQTYIEQIELLLTEGLNLPAHLAVEMDLDVLLRTDQAAQVEMLGHATGSGLLTFNEARHGMNRPSVGEAGDVIWRQEQEWPISELVNRRQEPTGPTLEGSEVSRYFNTLNKLRNIEHAK